MTARAPVGYSMAAGVVASAGHRSSPSASDGTRSGQSECPHRQGGHRSAAPGTRSRSACSWPPAGTTRTPSNWPSASGLASTRRVSGCRASEISWRRARAPSPRSMRRTRRRRQRAWSLLRADMALSYGRRQLSSGWVSTATTKRNGATATKSPSSRTESPRDAPTAGATRLDPAAAAALPRAGPHDRAAGAGPGRGGVRAAGRRRVHASADRVGRCSTLFCCASRRRPCVEIGNTGDRLA